MAYDWTTDPLATRRRQRYGRGPQTPVAGMGPIIPGDPAVENPPMTWPPTAPTTETGGDALTDPLSRWKDRTGSDLLSRFQTRYPGAQYNPALNWGQNVSSWARGVTGPAGATGPAATPTTGATGPTQPVIPRSPHKDTGPFGGREGESRHRARARRSH